jgi:uncharacterized BrkB/YihY/UPF0761 family membrane protein
MNYVLAACCFLIVMLGLSIYLSRTSWPYHTAGAKGYVTDMLIYFFLPVVPMLVCVGGFSLLTLIRPDFENETTRMVLLGVALVGLLGMRRLPFVAAAQERMRVARTARYEATR